MILVVSEISFRMTTACSFWIWQKVQCLNAQKLLVSLNGLRAEPLSFQGCGEIEIPAFWVLLPQKYLVEDIWLK